MNKINRIRLFTILLNFIRLKLRLNNKNKNVIVW